MNQSDSGIDILIAVVVEGGSDVEVEGDVIIDVVESSGVVEGGIVVDCCAIKVDISTTK